MFYQFISIAGALLILSAFTAHQLRRLPSDTARYQLLNLVGGFFLLVTAIAMRQYGFILMEGAWTVISGVALWHVWRKR